MPSALTSQGSRRILADGGSLNSIHLFVALIVLGATPVPALAQEGSAAAARPAWVVDGVPDKVWMLVEAAIGASDKDHTRTLLKQAEVDARSAVSGHEDDAGRWFALAVVLGLRAESEGGRTKIAAASELHKTLKTTLALDPTHARARHMLGRVHAGVLRMNRVTRWLATSLLGGAELKQATWQEAERNLAFAESHAPEVSDHHFQLAKLYADTKRSDLALVEVGHVLAMPVASAMERAAHDQALELKKKLGFSPTPPPRSSAPRTAPR